MQMKAIFHYGQIFYNLMGLRLETEKFETLQRFVIQGESVVY